MTRTEKLQRVVKLAQELKNEPNEAIVHSRIEGLAKELGVNTFQCGLVYWAAKNGGEFRSIFGNDVKVRFRAR